MDLEEDAMEFVEDNENEAEGSATSKVYLPGQEIADDEELVCEDSAYVMYHQAQTGNTSKQMIHVYIYI